MSSDDYEFMVVTIHAKSPGAVLLSNAATASDEIWIQKIWIHGMDISKVDDADIGDETELRVNRAHAYEKGLL